MTRKLVRRIGVGAAVVAGILLLAYATLHLPFVRALVLERARGYALSELGIVARRVESSLRAARSIGRTSQRESRVLCRRSRPFCKPRRSVVVLDRRVFRGVVAVDRLRSGRSAAHHRSSRERDHQPAARTIGIGRFGAARSRHGCRSARSRSRWPMNRPVARWRSDHWICRSIRHARPRDRGHLDRARSVSGWPAPKPADSEPRAATQTRQPITISGTLHGTLAFDGVRVTVPELRVDDAGRPARAQAVRRCRRQRSTPQHSRAAGRGPCPSGTADAVEPPAGVCAEHPRHRGGRRDGQRIRSPRPRWISPRQGESLAYGPLEGVRLVTKSSLVGNRIRVHQLDRLVGVGLSSRERRDRLARSGQHRTVRHRRQASLAVRWTDVDLDRALDSAGYALPASLGTRASGQAELRLRPADAAVDRPVVQAGG